MSAHLPPFWILVERHGGELLAHAQRISGDDAEDIVQEALLRALRAYPRLAHADHLRAWLYRITTTTAIDLRRRNRREVLVGEAPAGRVEPPADDGFDDLVASQTEERRAALRLRFVEDLEYAEMGRRLGCSPEAARQRVSTAVRALRKELST